jgi:hypothetical protein
VSTKHGAWSTRLVEPLAWELFAELQPILPEYPQEPSCGPALMRYCRTLAQVERLRDWLARTATDGIPWERNGEGELRGVTRLLVQLEASLGRQEQELGLTPVSRFRMGRDKAAASVDVAQLFTALLPDLDLLCHRVGDLGDVSWDSSTPRVRCG